MTYSAALHDAITALIGHAPEHIEPGKITRFPTSQRRRDDAGWVYLFDDEQGASFGDYRTGAAGHWSERDRHTMTPGEQAAFAAQIAKAKAKRDKAQADKWERNRPRIRSTWQAAHGLVMGDPVTLYLKRRGLGGMWPLPACLRYHPALPYWNDGEVIGQFPAMLARFHAADGRCVAIHQTYLTRDGRKADVPSPKKMSPPSGLLIGGGIPLAGPVDRVIGVAEGIETALCAGAASGLPVVASYSAGCMAGYQWPEGVGRLVIFADNDESGTGQAAARKLETRARAAGLAVSVLIPQTPGDDWADVYSRRDLTAVDAVADSLERARFADLEGGAE
jgi:putative DNA primase/helicase